MEVKVLYNFKDLEKNVDRKAGDKFECDVERAKFLIENGAVEEIKKAPLEEKEEILDTPVESVEDFKENKPKKKKRNN